MSASRIRAHSDSAPSPAPTTGGGHTPWARRASAVRGPTAAVRTPAGHRPQRAPASAVTALALATTTQSKASRPPATRAKAPGSGGGWATRIGHGTATKPAASSARASGPPAGSSRVTATRQRGADGGSSGAVTAYESSAFTIGEHGGP